MLEKKRKKITIYVVSNQFFWSLIISLEIFFRGRFIGPSLLCLNLTWIKGFHIKLSTFELLVYIYGDISKQLLHTLISEHNTFPLILSLSPVLQLLLVDLKIWWLIQKLHVGPMRYWITDTPSNCTFTSIAF